MFEKEIEIVARPINICSSFYFCIPKRKYKCIKGKYYKIKIIISEV